MSDNFEMLIDPEVSLAEATALAQQVVTMLRDRRLIIGELSTDCVLGGAGYPVGPAVREIYQLAPNEGEFWTLLTSGVEPVIRRTCNLWALGPSCEMFVCPMCDTTHADLTGQLGDRIFAAIDHWQQQEGDTKVTCTNCNAACQITEWHSKPPLGFGNLAFRFWNWPPFDSSSWTVDLPQLFRDVTGHPIVRSWGHI